ncbi:GlxA family transcriptional regulator [Deltaproteobacteria bacterium OttesenSCG-928-K17]|nr:GlxA family transcriptional regulator [Deltaproteobacteria bacterium OttesenSCG-928-K17]
MSAKSKNSRSGGVLKVGFILLPGFDLLPFSNFVETLRQCIDIGDIGKSAWTNWAVMARDPAPVPSSCGVSIIPGGTLREPTNFDYIVVAGGRLSGVEAAQQNIAGYLRKAADNRVPVAGWSSAVFIMAEAGLLKNRRCVVHWPHFQEFKTRFPEARPVVDEMFVEDRGIITCPGGTAAGELARHLIEGFFGPERLVKIFRRLMMDWNRPEDRLTAPGLDQYLDIPDPRVRRAVFFMTQNLSVIITTEDIAREARLSPRQLERLFKETLGKAPAEYLRALRLRQANWLVRHTSKTITDISVECGFADSSHFAKWYKDYFGLPPIKDRKQAQRTNIEAIAPS